MGLLCVVLLLQVSHEAHLEAVDVLDVPEDDLKLVVIEHVHALPALAQVSLQKKIWVAAAVRPSGTIQLRRQVLNSAAASGL